MFIPHMVLDHLEQLLGVFQFNNFYPMWGGDPPPPLINYDTGLYYIFWYTGRVFAGSGNLYCVQQRLVGPEFSSSNTVCGVVVFGTICCILLSFGVLVVFQMVLLEHNQTCQFIFIKHC